MSARHFSQTKSRTKNYLSFDPYFVTPSVGTKLKSF